MTSALRVARFSGHYKAMWKLDGVCFLSDPEVGEYDLPVLDHPWCSLEVASICWFLDCHSPGGGKYFLHIFE